jgi:hypothetical protein
MDRLGWKEPLHSLEVELQGEFGLSPVASRALIRRISEVLDTYRAAGAGARAPGQISYPAVAVGERAGKPLRYCLTVPVSLSVLHESDGEVLHGLGSPALRRARLARMSAEAYCQGAALSHEDLSLLLAVDLSTVRRLARGCTEEGARVPTRGVVEDIGPSVSHKEQVLQLYFAGLLPARIAARTGHSLGSVERYLGDFARVVQLQHEGLPAEVIARITGLTPRLVSSYLELAERYDRPSHQDVFARLLRRFAAPEVSDEAGERSHG